MRRKLREVHPAIWALVGVGILSALGLALYPVVFRTTCIVEGTPIDTPDGLVLIEKILPGAVVWTSGPDGRREPGRVTAVHPGESRAWLELVLEDDTRLQATARHPVRTPDDWVEAGLLIPGDLVLTRDGPRAVDSVLRREGDVRVFDLEVEPNPNFYAAGVLVHNKSRNDRNAAYMLMTFCTAQDDLRDHDRDRNGQADFWVADVSGLYAIQAADGLGIRLIDVYAATADAQSKPGAGGTRYAPIDPFQPKAGYQFRALTHYEDESGKRVAYDLGNGRNPARYAYVAEPAPGFSLPPRIFIQSEAKKLYWKEKTGPPVDTFPRDPLRSGWREWNRKDP